jgi:hypothetical protein
MLHSVSDDRGRMAVINNCISYALHILTANPHLKSTKTALTAGG